jgi:amidase
MSPSLSPFATAHSQLAALRRRDVSATELARAAIARIERLDVDLNAVVVRDFDRALADAADADAALARSENRPLLGVPMTVKESFDLAGHPTTWGLEVHRAHRAPGDALVVRRLKAAGAVVLGKTNVPPVLGDWQSENRIYGRTNNPWDLDRVPGGSSGGSAAAAAAGLSALEVGSDIGGSVRVPAGFCGVFGLKTSHGVISMQGHAAGGEETAPTPLSVIGPIARSAEDIDLLMSVIAGPDEEAPATALNLPAPRATSFRDFRILVLDRHPVAAADAEVIAALETVAAEAGRAGARILRASDALPDLAAMHRLYVKMLRTIITRRETSTREPVSAHAWMDMLDAQLRIRRQLRSLFQDIDIVLAPTFGTTAFPHAGYTEWRERRLVIDAKPASFGDQLGWISIATLGNLPSCAFPAGLDRQGLPISLQAIGPHLGDRTTTAFAALAGRFLPPPLYPA